jgi:RND superfamily putative drug exporter
MSYLGPGNSLLFARLGNAIVRWHRLIIPVWVFLLLLSYPFILQAPHSVSLEQGSTSQLGLESQVAQHIIDTQFGSSYTRQTLVVVISSKNVTTQAVRSFVDDLSQKVKSEGNLTGLVSVGTVYSSVSSLLGHVVKLDAQLANGTETLNQLIFGVPSLFLGVWQSRFNGSAAGIQPAQTVTSQLLSSRITNQTELTAARQYLALFASDLSLSIRADPSLPLQARLASTVKTAAVSLFNSSYFPPQLRQPALEDLHHFSLSNYSSPLAVERFVVSLVPQVSVFSSRLAESAYPVSAGNLSLDSLVNSVVAHPERYDIPPLYSSTVSGFVSADHRMMIVSLSFTNVTAADLQTVRSTVSSLSASHGLAGVAVTGQQALQTDIVTTEVHDNDVILPLTVLLLLVATALFFRSFLTPFVSLGTISIALGIAQTVIVLVADYVSKVDVSTPTILLTVMIGVGTDYTIFLLARYREERVRGRDPSEGIVRTVTWAGESIATSGATVIISFVFLGFQPITFLRSLGLVVGLGVLIALAASLTLIPSIIVLIPDRIFFPNSGSRFASYASRVRESLEKKRGYFSRSGVLAIRHAKLILVLSIIVTVPAVYAWSNINPSYDFLSSAPRNLESVSSFNSLTSSFGAGAVFPTYVVMQFKEPVLAGGVFNMRELQLIDLASNITLSSGQVNSVTGPTRPGGQRVDFYHLGNDTRSASIISSMKGSIGNDTRYALLKISLRQSPYTQASISATESLRSKFRSLASNYSQYVAGIYVGGAAGSIVDTSNVVNSEFYQVIGYVTLAVGVVLLFVLGSLFLPVFAIVSIVMSIAWTIAATQIVFGYLYSFPILFITPLTLFVLLLGLGMDYNIFILTRIREEASKGNSLNQSILTSIQNTGGIITAAAVILAGSLGALMLSSSLLLKEFGFAFAFSILLDAMVMRTYVVPAVMSLMGRWNWYAPGRLQRVKSNESG